MDSEVLTNLPEGVNERIRVKGIGITAIEGSPRAYVGTGWLILTSVVALFAVAGIIVSAAFEHDQWAKAFSVVAASCAVFIALLAGALRTDYGHLVLAALFCCALGDVIGPGHFIGMAYAFMTAYLLLIPACLLRGPSFRRLGVGLVIVLCLNAFLLAMLIPSVPAGEQMLVAAFMVVTSIMVIVSIGASKGNFALALGGLMWATSDILFAHFEYLDILLLGFGSVPTYYLGSILIAISIRVDLMDAFTRAQPETIS
jgi:hypothetical protein